MSKRETSLPNIRHMHMKRHQSLSQHVWYVLTHHVCTDSSSYTSIAHWKMKGPRFKRHFKMKNEGIVQLACIQIGRISQDSEILSGRTIE